MTRQLVLLALAAALTTAGCNRPTYRAQGPFAKRRAADPAPAALTDARPALATTAPVPTPGADAPGSPKPVGTSGSPNTSDAPATPKPDANLAALKALARTAADKWQTMDNYEAALATREVAGNNPVRAEDMLFRFRKEPLSVYMRNVGASGRGREVLYFPQKHEDKIHCIVGEGDSRIMRAGSKAPSLTPDSPLVRSKSRHSIREAGFGVPIEKFAGLVARLETGKLPADALRSLGIVTRPEFGDRSLAAVEYTLPPGEESAVEKGGVRRYYFDADPASPSHGLPVLVTLHENAKPAPREVEYYCYTNIKSPAGLTDTDFDPAGLGKAK